MFQQKSGSWQWYFVNRENVCELPADPAVLLPDADIIKETPGTIVFRKDGLFFKWEKNPTAGFWARLKNRFFSRAGRELDTLRQLQKAGFETTPPVGYGISGGDCILITREVCGGISVLEHICQCYEKGETFSDDFLAGWGRFWGSFLKSGFYFPDFHCGNILYIEKENRFVLVDLYGVRRAVNLRPGQQQRMIFRQMKDAMEFLDCDELKLVLKNAGIAEDEAGYSAFLEFYAGEAQTLLLRRMRDFDEQTLRYRPGRKKWNFAGIECRELPETVLDEVWMKDFALQHHGIPHLHLLERNGGKVKMEKSAGFAPNEASLPLRKRVESAGYDPEEFVYCFNSTGKTVVCDRKVML